LLQDILGEYDGTVLLVSHDRDFIDRIATATVAMEGGGRATVYPGGWSDYANQRPQPIAEPAKSAPKPAAAPTAKTEAAARGNGLSFTERKRLEDLPALIARLETEILKLSNLLADAELFSREPVKFRKATEALAERQSALDAAETEWLELAERA
jgi:ATP-binding cassette subfamily F protein uup